MAECVSHPPIPECMQCSFLPIRIFVELCAFFCTTPRFLLDPKLKLFLEFVDGTMTIQNVRAHFDDLVLP